MAITITYGSYTYPGGTASHEVSLRTILDERGQERRGASYRWMIRGALIADGPAAIKVLKDALLAAHATGGQDLKMQEGATVYEELLSADTKGGTRVVDGPTFADSRGGVWLTSLPYTVVIEGDVYDGEAGLPGIIELEERTVYDVAQDGHTTRTLTGRLQVADGQSALDKATGRDPGTPVGYQRMGYRRDINETDDEATYDYRDWEYWTELPTDVTGGGYTDRRRVTGINAQRLSRTGRFTGVGAQDAADAAKIGSSDYQVLSEEQVLNVYDASVAFAYEYFDKASSDDVIFFEERITLQEAGKRFTLRPVLGPNTKIDSDSFSGQPTVNVADSGGFNAGDYVVIDPGGNLEESGIVQSTGVGTITLTTDLTQDHTSGDADDVVKAPVKQEIAYVGARGTQSGRSTGKESYPSFPAKKFSTTFYDKEASTETKDPPRAGIDGGLVEYGIAWNYVYRLPTQTSLPDPNTP